VRINDRRYPSYIFGSIMKVTLIHNADAGDDDSPTLGQLEALIEEAGHSVRSQSVKKDGWSKALKKRADLVAVAGGDGTVGKVARRMVGRKTPLAVLPMGTANNIANSLGIAKRQATELIAGWSKADRVEFDVGTASGPWGERHFIEGVGMGLFTHAMPWIERNRNISKQPGEVRLAYALQLMREHLNGSVPVQLNATLDGEDISGAYLLFEAMNTRYVGPNLFLAPDVEHGAGLLHVVCVADKQRETLRQYLTGWQNGTMWPADLGVYTGRRLEIEWTGYPVHLDDKLWPDEDDKPPKPPVPVEITIERAALQFLVPASAMQR